MLNSIKRKKWRKKAISGVKSDLERFCECRKELKDIMNKKMRLNVSDESDPAIISTKFWSYVKSKCKSARIPETVHYEQRYKRNCSEQAEMFNEYFSKQFSEPSVYDTDTDFKNTCALNNLQFHELDIDLYC